VCVDVEASVGEDAEFLVLLAMEAEGVAVAAREPRVAARHAGVEVADLHALEAKSLVGLLGAQLPLRDDVDAACRNEPDTASRFFAESGAAAARPLLVGRSIPSLHR